MHYVNSTIRVGKYTYCKHYYDPSLYTVSARRNNILEELSFFIEMTHVEQQAQMTDELPSVEQYMEYRMGTGAVRLCLALNE